MQGDSLPIPGVTIRAGNGSICVHVDPAAICATSARSRDFHPRVPRRLAGSSSRFQDSPGAVANCTGSGQESGISGQLRQISVDSSSISTIPRGTDQSEVSDSSAPSVQVSGHTRESVTHSECLTSSGIRMEHIAGQTSLPLPSGSRGQTALSSVSVQSQSKLDVRLEEGQAQADSSAVVSRPSPPVVVTSRASVEGCASGSTIPNIAIVHGREFGGVGSPPPSSDSVRPMVTSGEEPSHQFAGDVSCLQGSDIIPADVEKSNSDDCLRQFDSPRLSSQSGRHQECSPSRTDLSVLSAGRQYKHDLLLPTHTRQEEHSGGSVISKRPGDSNRVDVIGTSTGTAMAKVVQASDRRLCDLPDPSPSGLLLSSSGSTSTGNRCTVSVMGRPSALHVPADTTLTHSTSQAPISSARRSDSDIPEEPTSTVVSSPVEATQSSRSSARPASSKRRSHSSTHHRSSHAQRSSTQLSRIETLKACWRDRGSSDSIATKLTKSKADSTNIVYDAKWRIFALWCQKQRPPITPTKVRRKQVVEFLNLLIDKKKPALSTFEGYLSALNSVFQYCDRGHITSSEEVKGLARYLKITNPKSSVQPPKWNLPYVLHRLSEAPFEPLDKAEFKYLTWKTAFLIIWGAACRRSEVHALDVDAIKHCPRWSRVELSTLPGFRAKNQHLDDPTLSRTYTLQELVPASSEDTLSCPVRALRIYLRRSKDVRDSRRRLFLPLIPQGKIRDITANTLSSWIKKTVHMAYSPSGRPTHDAYLRRLYSVGDDEVANLHRSAHEIRAQSATYSFVSARHSLASIMKSCYWRSSTVFTNFYLRDITMEDTEHLLRLSTQVLQGGNDARVPHPPST